ncbi:MAG: 30S ribosomal protein S5 [Candidatus Pacebacteria bacterium]|nr:30S ribosomal protein S5 [Candidatus Paceibacterota bacterium]
MEKTEKPKFKKEFKPGMRRGRKPIMKKKSIESDFDQKILEVKRVTRVTKGGKKISFRVAMLIGNKKNKVGFAVGKGVDVPSAIDKAKRSAMENLIYVPIVKDTIPCEVEIKFCSSVIVFKPAKKGKGIIAGGVARDIIKMTKIQDITTKILGKSHNVINNASAVMEAFKTLEKKYQLRKEMFNNKKDLEKKHANS